MLLSSAKGPPARDEAWAFEVKFDGMRSMVEISASGAVQVWSRHGVDHTAAFPELRGLAGALRGRSAMLDGEIVCMVADRPSFARLRRRWVAGAGSARFAEALARQLPATLVAFDVLELGGTPLLSKPYEERRARLADLALKNPHWIATDHQVGRGADVIAASRTLGFEGVVAKRLTSRYHPGMRSPDWLKIKNYKRGTFTVGGWLVSSRGGIEALYVGRRGAHGELRFEGTVEFGLERQRRELRACLELVAQAESPFAGWKQSPRTSVRWTRPMIAAEVRYIGHDAGVLREAILENVALAERRGPVKAAPPPATPAARRR
jgi:bifunctional non-homologous end joining protein LigD